MKKLLTLIAIVALSTSFSYAATNNARQQFKQDIQKTRADLKSAVKADIENNKKANDAAAQEKKKAKIAEINNKIQNLNAQVKEVKANKTISETERTLKINRLQSQINYYEKQKAALQ